MSRRSDTTIPLVLWISAALVVHYSSYQGADAVADISTGKNELRSFANAIHESLKPATTDTFEVTFEGETKDEASEEKPEPQPIANAPKPELPKVEQPKPKVEPPKVEQPKPKVALAEPPKKADEPPPPQPAADKRVAVVQNVQDQNQQDNPNARFIADNANHVKEETQAEITSRDRNDDKPTPGTAALQGPKGEVGNADKTRIADSEDKAGAQDRPAGEAALTKKDTELPKLAGRANAPDKPAPAQPTAANLPPADKAGQNGRAGPRAPAPSPQPQPVAQPSPQPAQAPETVNSPNGTYAVSPFRKDAPKADASSQLPESKAPEAVARPFSLPKLGGGPGPRGVNFNLTPGGALAAFGGPEKVRQERALDGERRKSAHRGTWTAPNFERYRAAMENYIAAVKPGNQTALNTAAVPFASYLQKIHNRIHPIFADGFLDSLESLPGDNPINDQKLKMEMEVVLSGEDGSIVNFGRTKSSGVTAFDVAAMHAFRMAAGSGFGKPPSAILSTDGHVYLHWEFHRQREIACSTINARPYMLNLPSGGSQPSPILPGPRVPSGDPREQVAPPSTPPPSREGSLPPPNARPAKRAG